MAGCNAIRTDTGGFIDEMMEFDVVIAEDAGTWCLAPEIRFNERSNDGVLKILFQVQDVVWNAELSGDTTGVPQIVERAASAVIAPKLHREADDLFASLFQQNSRGG